MNPARHPNHISIIPILILRSHHSLGLPTGLLPLATGCLTLLEDIQIIWSLLLTWLFRLLTYLLTPWSRVFLQKLIGSAASQEIPRIFGTRRFLTVLTSVRHLSLSWANSIQSPQLPPTSWRSILILSSHLRLGLPNGLFPSGLPTRTLCTPLPSPICATCPAHLILLVSKFSITFFLKHFSF